jgi:hypothetical protein
MRTVKSRLKSYNTAANKACKVAQLYADGKQLGSVLNLYKLSVLLLADANLKIDTGFTNQEITDKEIDYALKYIKNV